MKGRQIRTLIHMHLLLWAKSAEVAKRKGQLERELEKEKEREREKERELVVIVIYIIYKPTYPWPAPCVRSR